MSLTEFLSYFSFPYVRHAFIVGALVALCASLLGVVLVLRRYSYLGDGLSHVAFGGMAIATVLNMTDNLMLVMPLTIISAIILLSGAENKKIGGDASLAMLSVGSLSVGYILLNLFPASSNVAADVCSSLFGSASILTLKSSDVILCVLMSLSVLCVFVLFYNKIFALTFDPVFMQGTGGNAKACNLLLATLTAVIISISMRLVGSLLVSALIIFPAISAMTLQRSFKKAIVSSAAIGVICALLGMVCSLVFSTPTGATIVTLDIAAFFICKITAKALGR